ncbi:PREDICTED: uncharacterized protein LOC109232489 [Nicotiana attenuata]|uniref:uncharacterized protein LOC109232489 n=1 Tax=Nicotiana attenuata TaxID=49451 RepID=UPI000904C6FC|nr:PREDICTED: uncharacterized protein LOC109232489 [Nicotiana attenuata]
MDQESTTQNFINVARRGDLSPRQMEKVKSAAKGRKKQQKENMAAPTAGVQTRRTLTKSSLTEPKQQAKKLERYRNKIGFAQAISNVSNKIWAFIDDVFEVTVMYNMVQQLTLRLYHTESHVEMVLTLVYAKCDAIERIELWDSLYAMARDMEVPWLVGGDFNVIWDEEEKFGGLPVSLNEIDDFRHCVNTCNLFDLGFKGIEVEHLSKIGSDHSPMQLKCDIEAPIIKKPFRFLNFWVENESFKEVVRENWKANFSASPYILFNHKLKKLKKALALWSKATFSDIFQKIASMEEVVLVHEIEFEANPTKMNRERLQKVQAELIKVLALEEKYRQQKAEEQEIADEAINFYKEQFTETAIPSSFDIINCVPNLIDTEQNAELIKKPTKEEVKVAMFGLNGDSAGGPDGMTGRFYQSCWDIVGDDIFDMVRAFFNGHDLPKCVTHTNLVLLPKKKLVTTFSDLRSISLSNFSNKEHSKNILLTQEIVTDMRLRTKAGPNVIMKLDMTKSYDRLSWLFLTKVLRRMGFSERFIGMVFGIVSNNCYSILINGQAHGFFKSSRGVKQGDPVSPTLFILAAEAPSRGLNALHKNLYFCGYGMPKWSPKINHLAYVDNMIIFSSSDGTSLLLIMEVFSAYEAASGQLVNRNKSVVYLHQLSDLEMISKVERITGINRQEFLIIYLGCPIFYARRKLEYYQPMITKVMDRLQSWKGKLLFVGGSVVLIAHVLQSMPIHLLSVVNPPNYVINRLHKIFAQFFWSSSIGGTSRHWASWNTLCMPVEEGGIGFRSLHDVSKALFSKLWWNYRTKPSLWSSFISQKYCKKMNSVIVPWRKGSHIWRKMLECRDLIEYQIIWQPKMGSSLFWFDNWTGLGALYFLVPQEFGIDEYVHNVYDVIEDGGWDVDRLYELLPEEYAVWKAKLPLDDFMRRLGYFMPSKCWCCVQPKEESLQHLFFRSETARVVWYYFLSRAGITVEGLSMHQAITKCWTANVCPRLKPIMQALPSCIVWELWKRRNGMKYGDVVSTSRVIYQVSITLQALVKVRKPGIKLVPHKWHDLLKMMENYTPTLKVNKVMCEFPSAGWLMVNTDGASRGNPGRSSIGYCVRDEKGDIVWAVGKEIEETTNTVAEAKAMVEALRFCRTQQYSHIWLLTDSMLLKKIMDGLWKPPWIINEQVEEIRQLMNGGNYTVSHIYREGVHNIFLHLAWMELHMVVLVLRTQSIGRPLKQGKDIVARKGNLLRKTIRSTEISKSHNASTQDVRECKRNKEDREGNKREHIYKAGKVKIKANLPRMSKRNGQNSSKDSGEWIGILWDIGSHAGIWIIMISKQGKSKYKRSWEREVDRGSSSYMKKVAGLLRMSRRNGQHENEWLGIVEEEGVGPKEQQAKQHVRKRYCIHALSQVSTSMGGISTLYSFP